MRAIIIMQFEGSVTMEENVCWREDGPVWPIAMTGPGTLASGVRGRVGSSLLWIPLDTQNSTPLHLPEVLCSVPLLETRTVALSYVFAGGQASSLRCCMERYYMRHYSRVPHIFYLRTRVGTCSVTSLLWDDAVGWVS